MAKLDYLVPVGIFKKTQKYIAGHLSFRKMLSELLKRLNVAFYDPCCPAAYDVEPQFVPVRYDLDSGEIQFLDPESNEWSVVPPTTTSTTTTTTLEG